MIKEIIHSWRNARNKIYNQKTGKLEFTGPTLHDLWEQLRDLKGCESEIRDTLQEITEQKLWKDLGIWLMVASCHPSPKYVDTLNELVLLGDIVPDLDSIVDMLYDYASPSSIPALKKTLNYRLNYDFAVQLPVKILQALENINTKESIQVIQSMVQSEEEHIREEALAILEELSEANDH